MMHSGARPGRRAGAREGEMRMLLRRLFSVTVLVTLLAGLAVVLVSCGSREPELIPRTVLMGNPEKMKARLSPDGTRLAYVAPVGDVLNVWVKTIGQDDDRPVTNDDRSDARKRKILAISVGLAMRPIGIVLRILSKIS